MRTTMYRDAVDSDALTIAAKFSVSEATDARFVDAIFREVAQQIAKRFVDEHYADIAAKLDQNAIANLAIAEASKKIAEEIQRRPVIHEKTKHQVWQRGLLGGLRRIL